MVNEEVERRAEEDIMNALRKLAGHMLIDRPEPDEYDRQMYKRFVIEHEPAIRKAIKLSTFKFEPEPYLAKNRYFGTRFDAGSVARGDYKNFSRVLKPIQKSGLRVALNIDESGSMSGREIEQARLSAIIVYEYCQRMGIPIDIMGFDNDIRNYVSSDFPSEKDGPRLLGISAMGGTDDDIPLEIARRNLNRYPESKKLIIVISDGFGNAEEVKRIVKECQRENIVILTMALGDSRGVLEDIYGRDSYMNIEDLSILPQMMVKKIKSMLF